MDILSKQLLLDPLDLGVKFGGGVAQTTDTGLLQTLPLSIAFTYEVDEWQNNEFNFINSLIYPVIGIRVGYVSASNRLDVVWSNKGIDTVDHRTSSYWIISSSFFYTDSYNGTGLPTGKHTLQICFYKELRNGSNYNNSTIVIPESDTTTIGRLRIQVYLDGELLKLINPNGVFWGYRNYAMSTNPLNYYPIKDGAIQLAGSGSYTVQQTPANNFKGKLSNVKIFNFLTDQADAPYTLDDYQNDKDIPDGISGVILNLHNKLSGSTWTDDSGNANNMTLSGDISISEL